MTFRDKLYSENASKDDIFVRKYLALLDALEKRDIETRPLTPMQKQIEMKITNGAGYGLRKGLADFHELSTGESMEAVRSKEQMRRWHGSDKAPSIIIYVMGPL